MVRAAVIKHFRNVSSGLASQGPDLLEKLDSIQLSQDQKTAVANTLRAISDPRVQRIGLLAAHAIRDSSSADPAIIRQHVFEKLKPQLSDMRQLSDEILPSSVETLMAKSSGV